MKVMYILVKAKSKKQIKRKNEYNVEANEYVKQIRNVLTWATLGIYCFLLWIKSIFSLPQMTPLSVTVPHILF